MKHTAFYNKHLALRAKMSPFAGYEMPIFYSGINDEHETVRRNVGVFDVSHMGEFIIKGEKAIDLLQQITSNDVTKLVPGKAQYSCLPNEHGGIVDDILVYKLDNQTFMVVANAANIQKDWNWIMRFNTMGVEMHDISDQTSLLAVQGPKAAEVMQPLTSFELGSLKYYTFVKGKFCGFDNILISATGYTGSGGFEIFFDNQYADAIWDKIFESGKNFGIKPIGLGARDTLRLEMGYCLYGNDIDDNTSPLEAGLSWITKFSKKFTNSNRLLEQKNTGVSKMLCGFVMTDKSIPRHNYEIVNAKGEEIGKVTSGTMSPSLKKGIGLGYIKTEFAQPGKEIFIKVRNSLSAALVSKIPFVQGGL